MSEYYHPGVETMSREDLEVLREKLLRGICTHAWRGSRFYRDLWSSRPRAFTPDDMAELPFTGKEDLVEAFPFGLCAVPRGDIVRMHLTSGSSGRPSLSLLSGRDIESSSEISARSLYMRGARPDDVLQITLAYGLWAAGLSGHLAAERIGCMVIPSGPGNTKRQIWLMRTLGTTILSATPNYYLRIAEVAGEMGVDLSSLDLRIGLSVAGRLGPPLRREIEEGFDIDIRNVYGMTEVGGIGSECFAHDGLHTWEDALYLEVVDPETGEVLGPGERGELVVTTLRRRAQPLIRYRTGDMTCILSDDGCECGRTHLRISQDIDRVDDTVKIRGILVSPKSIERCLGRFPELTGNFLMKVRKSARPILLCELHQSVESAFMEEVSTSVAEELKNKIGLTFETLLVPYGEMPRGREDKRIQVDPDQFS
jgi:phenylacetate-CoA ligase